MLLLRHNSPGFQSALRKLQRRPHPTPAFERSVASLIAAVRKGGDPALCKLIAKFGGPSLRPSQLRVPSSEMPAPRSIPVATRTAVALAHRNVASFAKKSLRLGWKTRNPQGVQVGERFDPFQRVGIYVPGGTAPLVSTAIMTVTLAAVAGVPEIVVTTPPGPDGRIDPSLLYALRLAGATEIYKAGGAQAIAAMAYGTARIAPVLKIFGPGNAWVVEAKRQVFGAVAIDLLPGPSEIIVLSDKTGRPASIAADLLAQAEHGHGSAAGLITDSAPLLRAVSLEIQRQRQTLTRRAHLAQALDHTFLLQVKKLEDAIPIINGFAPEHLSIRARNQEALSRKIRTAGAIFLGEFSPVAGGDFVAGPSHELPTGGAGKSFSGLTVDQFQRRTSLIRFDAPSLRKSLAAIETFSRIEGLDAHGASARIRFE